MAISAPTPVVSPAPASSYLVAVLFFALGAAASSVAGYYAMFTGFAPWDDSGYLLLGLRQYMEGGALYDELYAQYGPAYFQLVAAIFGALGVELTHAVARTFVLVVWIATSVASGVTAYRLTRNLPVALVVQLLVFHVLISSRTEPMVAGSVVALAVALIVLVGAGLRSAHHPRAAASIGALVAFAALTKINIGIFAAVAAGFVLATVTRWPRAGRLLSFAAALAVVLVPPAYMAARLQDGWVQAYLVVVVCSALAVVLAQSASAVRSLSVRTPIVAAVACVAVGALSCGLTLARGTSVSGLVHGVILDALRTPNVFSVPVRLTPWAPWWAFVALTASAAIAGLRWRGRWDGPLAWVLEGPVQLLAGVAIWLAAAGLLPARPLSISLPLLWLPLAARPARSATDGEIGRALLVAMAVMQSLGVYPIAGSQGAWATFLFVPVGGLAVAGGWRAAIDWATPRVQSWARVSRAAGVLAVVGVVAFTLYVAVYAPLRRFQSEYSRSAPLGLHGTGPIRVPVPTAAAFQRLTEQLSKRCRSFVTMPGLNSLYLFTRIPPPTMLNTTTWMTLLDDDQQRRIRRRLIELPGPLCAVRHRGVVAFWTQGRDVSGTVLARYIDERFVTEFTVSGYEFMVERGAPHRGVDAIP